MVFLLLVLLHRNYEKNNLGQYEISCTSEQKKLKLLNSQRQTWQQNAINELEKLIVRGGDVQNHAANQLSFSFKLLAKCQTIADERNCHKTIPGDNDNFR